MGQRGDLRIVGGAWRGRRIPIADAPGLRPTPDRVRETLFNWLAPQLPGARCLDAFAGSGVLGLEALSRGATGCVFMEPDRRCRERLAAAIDTLGATGAVIDPGRSPEGWPGLAESGFDLVFLDPPFDADLLIPALAALPPRLRPGHRVYLEFAARREPDLPAGWAWHRRKRAGDVGYGLATWSGAGEDAEHD
ncbi:MAG: 16S rRNA (guanine(966)-N(2))-methyltransferase RsmD [Salinisphaeraceae bacterium]